MNSTNAMRFQFTIRGMMLVTALCCVCFGALRWNIFVGSFLSLTIIAAAVAQVVGWNPEWSAALVGGLLGAAVERICVTRPLDPFTVATGFWTLIGFAAGAIVGLVLSVILPSARYAAEPIGTGHGGDGSVRHQIHCDT